MADKEKMKIDVFNTHIEIYPYSLGDIPVIEKMYTAIDHHSGMLVPSGFLIDTGTRYIPRGTPISRLEYIPIHIIQSLFHMSLSMMQGTSFKKKVLSSCVAQNHRNHLI